MQSNNYVVIIIVHILPLLCPFNWTGYWGQIHSYMSSCPSRFLSVLFESFTHNKLVFSTKLD